MDEENKQAFLSELKQLSEKYGIYVYGCGCCAVLQDKNGKEIEREISYDDDLKKYW